MEGEWLGNNMSGDSYSLSWQLCGPESEGLLKFAPRHSSYPGASFDLMAIHVMLSPTSGPLLFLLRLTPTWGSSLPSGLKGCFGGNFSELRQLYSSLLFLH